MKEGLASVMKYKTDHQIGSRRKTAVGAFLRVGVTTRDTLISGGHRAPFPCKKTRKPMKEGLASVMKYKTDHQIGSRRKTAAGPFPESVPLHVTHRPWEGTELHPITEER